MAAQQSLPWGNAEVMTFLSLVAEDGIQKELNRVVRNERVFQQLSNAMAARGFPRSSNQCRAKLKKLRCEYRANKNHASGTDRRTWKWFTEMEAIYGETAASDRRECGVDTAAVASTSVMSNTGKRKRGKANLQMVLERMREGNKRLAVVSKRNVSRLVQEMRLATETNANLRRQELAQEKDFNQSFLAALNACLNPKLLQHTLDVNQMLMIKEVPEDNRPYSDLLDCQPQHTMEEQEGVCISLGGEHLSGKEVVDPIRFPVPETPSKSGDDKCPPLLLQLCQDQIKRGELPEGDRGGESIGIENHSKSSISLNTKDTEEDDDAKCPVSELQHVSDSGLSISREINSRRPQFCCDVCGKVYNQRSCLTKHMVMHTGLKPFLCELCGKSFSRKNYFTVHMQFHTGDKPVCCDLCGHRFIYKSQLNRHMMVHTGQKPFCCVICGRRFRVKDSLRQHMLVHTGQKPYSCEVCEQRFASKSQVNRHMNVHTGKKPFSCVVCGMRFTEKASLKTHQMIHTGQKPFSCSFCGEQYRLKSQLKRHTALHTDQELYSCDVCGKHYVEKRSLKEHMIIHTGQKSFRCDACGKLFFHKSHLKRHMLIHTGQRPFCCDVCGQKFVENGDLKKHMMSHTGQKPFCCDVCGKKFAHKHNLTKHMSVHAESKPFCCDLCGYRFAKKSDLNRHLIIHNQGEMDLL